MTPLSADEPQGADQRHYARVHVPDGVHIACEGLAPKFRGRVRVVSPRGVFIQTTCTFPRGTRLHLHIDFDGEVCDLEGVVRDIEAQGIGVEFLALSDEQQEALARFTLKIPA